MSTPPDPQAATTTELCQAKSDSGAFAAKSDEDTRPPAPLHLSPCANAEGPPQNSSPCRATAPLSPASVRSEAGGEGCKRTVEGADKVTSLSDLSQCGQLPHGNELSRSDVHEASAEDSVESEPPEPLERPTGNVIEIVHSLRVRAGGNMTQGDSTRRVREEKLKQTEKRRNKAMHRFNLIEDMFARAVERRVRAMQRIAADPPAERLIGHSSLQHIPVALLPRQVRETALALAGAPAEGTAELTARAPSFFITDVDANPPGARSASTAEGGGSPVEDEAQGADGEERKETEDGEGGAAEGAKGTRSDPNLNEELLRRWRELGYTAVFLPATRRLIDTREPLHSHGPTRLAPLPPMHLVQRQLPLQPASRPRGAKPLPLPKGKNMVRQR